MQGYKAAEKIAEAIDNMNKYGQADILIVSRGGGSLEDLWCFNEEIVVRSIYNSKTPIISAVGHETDTTLSDYASDYRAPTPSAAAEVVAVDRKEILQQLDQLHDSIKYRIHQTVNNYSEKVNILQKRHGLLRPQMILENYNEKLAEISYRMKQNLNNHIKELKEELESSKGPQSGQELINDDKPPHF